MRRRTVIWIIGLLVGFVVISGSFLVVKRLHAASDTPLPITLEAVKGITYGIAKDPETQTLTAGVEYDYASVAGVQAYKTLNQEALKQLENAGTKTLWVQVVFNHPLSQVDFEHFVATNNLTVTRYSLRAVEATGRRVTIYGGPVAQQLVPANLLSQVSEDVQNRGAARVRGWITVSGTLPIGKALQVSTDPNVFLLDVMETVVRQSLTAKLLAKTGLPETAQRAYLSGEARLPFSRPPLFWSLEDLGLIQSSSRE